MNPTDRRLDTVFLGRGRYHEHVLCEVSQVSDIWHVWKRLANMTSFSLSSFLELKSSCFMTFFSPVFATEKEFSINYPAMNIDFNHSLPQNSYMGVLGGFFPFFFCGGVQIFKAKETLTTTNLERCHLTISSFYTTH